MERYSELKTRAYPSHELNIAQRIKAGYHLELEIEFQGGLMLFLHGIKEDTRFALDRLKRNGRIYDIANGDAFLYLPYQGHIDDFQTVVDILTNKVESLEAFPVVGTR